MVPGRESIADSLAHLMAPISSVELQWGMGGVSIPVEPTSRSGHPHRLPIARSLRAASDSSSLEASHTLLAAHFSFTECAWEMCSGLRAVPELLSHSESLRFKLDGWENGHTVLPHRLREKSNEIQKVKWLFQSQEDFIPFFFSTKPRPLKWWICLPSFPLRRGS